mmetsp:Transcript_12333/g.26569  ORF Transcript_12333/g.26569 Transcript_12333/m.26569 type:complete len:265 (+) Transcript_12333:142-936(+)
MPQLYSHVLHHSNIYSTIPTPLLLLRRDTHHPGMPPQQLRHQRLRSSLVPSTLTSRLDEFLQVRRRLSHGPRGPHGEHGPHPRGGNRRQSLLGKVPPSSSTNERSSGIVVLRIRARYVVVVVGDPLVARGFGEGDASQQFHARLVPRRHGGEAHRPGFREFVLVPQQRVVGPRRRRRRRRRRLLLRGAPEEGVVRRQPGDFVGNETPANGNRVAVRCGRIVVVVVAAKEGTQTVPDDFLRQPQRRRRFLRFGLGCESRRWRSES